MCVLVLLSSCRDRCQTSRVEGGLLVWLAGWLVLSYSLYALLGALMHCLATPARLPCLSALPATLIYVGISALAWQQSSATIRTLPLRMRLRRVRTQLQLRCYYTTVLLCCDTANANEELKAKRGKASELGENHKSFEPAQSVRLPTHNTTPWQPGSQQYYQCAEAHCRSLCCRARAKQARQSEARVRLSLYCSH